MRRSYIWAALFAAVMIGWLASGQLTPGIQADGPSKPVPAATSQTDQPFKVTVRTFASKLRKETISVRGRTEAFRVVEVRARTKGIVEKSPLREGDTVKTGDLLCELDMANRPTRLSQAQAQLQSAKRDFEAVTSLSKQRFASEAKKASERARMDAASYAVEEIEWDIRWTKVASPVNGILASRPAEQGSYLQVGQLCASVTVLDPIIVTGQVGERLIGKLQEDQPAKVTLVTGDKLEGVIRHIAPKADIATRTFKVEVQVKNPDNSIRDGITAEILIPLTASPAHLLPAKLLGLNDDGVIGVKSVGDNNQVRFHPVRILQQTRQGTWVAGLPDRITLITAGQDYVVEGEKVEPVPEEQGVQS